MIISFFDIVFTVVLILVIKYINDIKIIIWIYSLFLIYFIVFSNYLQ